MELETIKRSVSEVFPKNRKLFPKREESELLSNVARAVLGLWQSFYRGSKLIILCVGHDGHQARQFADELIGSTELQAKPLAAMTLTPPFVRRIQALVRPYDVVFVSCADETDLEEIRKALEEAKRKQCFTIGLLSRKSKALADAVDISVVVSGYKTNRIRERQRRILRAITAIAQDWR